MNIRPVNIRHLQIDQRGLYKQPGSLNWSVEFQIKGIGRVRETLGTADRKQAAIAATKLRADYHERARLGVTTMRLDVALERYGKLQLAKSHGRPAVYVSVAKRLAEAFGAATLLDDITTQRIAAWSEQMLHSGKKLRTKGGTRGQTTTSKHAGLKPGSVNRYLILLNSVMRIAHRKWKTLAAMPVIELLKDKAKRAKKDKLYLTHSEEKALMIASPIWLRHVEQFLLGTGARKMEACNLVWENVFNLQSNAEYAEVKFQHAPEEGRTTKNGESRMVPLPPSVRELLIRLRKWQRDEGYTGDFVFVHKAAKGGENGFVRSLGLNKPFNAACRKAAIKSCVIHTLRHTFASRLVMAGEPLLNVRDLLGHKDFAVTQIYAHLAPNNLAKSVARLDALAAAAA